MLNRLFKGPSARLYARLLRYAGRYRKYFVISLFGFLLFSAMEAAMAKLMEYFVKGLETREGALLVTVPLLVVAARALHGVGFFFGNFYIAKVGLGVVNDLRKELFSAFIYLPNRFYDRTTTGELTSLLIYNIQQVTGSVTNAVKSAMRDGFTVAALLGYMFYENWQLTFCFLLIAPILAGLVSIASRYFRKLSHRMQVSMGGITHIANEALQGFRLVRSFVAQRYEIDRFNAASDHNTRLATKYERVASIQGPIFHIVIAIDLAVMLFLVLWLWHDNVGSAVAYLTAAAMIAKPLRQLSSVNEMIQKGLAAAESIFEVIDLPPEPDPAKSELVVSAGRIEFKDVVFRYHPDEPPALAGVNLVIEPGQTVALVGRSGSGKSTLANLLLRFYELESGVITIDGQNIAEASLASLRRAIALVNQQTVLFNDSVAKNIAYGQWDDSEAVVQGVAKAAEHASARLFIEELPERYETMLGEDGARLSGGQKQRIAVARALYKDSAILVLDEATSALDNESERAIQTALEALQQGRTTLVIAHRLSTIESADRIVVMERGQIVEQGSHPELIGSGGHYAQLHAAQFENS